MPLVLARVINSPSRTYSRGAMPKLKTQMTSLCLEKVKKTKHNLSSTYSLPVLPLQLDYFPSTVVPSPQHRIAVFQSFASVQPLALENH